MVIIGIGLIYALGILGVRIASGAFGIGGIALAFAAQASRETCPSPAA